MADALPTVQGATVRERMLFRAEMAEDAQRWADMVAEMDDVAKLGQQLSVEERSMFLVAHKHVLQQLRHAWRQLSRVEEAGDMSRPRKEQTAKYRVEVARELRSACEAMQVLLRDYLLPNDSSTVGRVLYTKTSADYFRYLAEVTDFKSAERHDAAMRAQQAYENALQLADKLGMSAAHAVRVGTSLNFACFLCEVMSKSAQAVSTGSRAFDVAVDHLHELGPDAYADSAAVMQRLKDNLLMWTSDPHADAYITSNEGSEDG